MSYLTQVGESRSSWRTTGRGAHFIDIATDWLAVGIDPNRSTMFIQSEVPAIDELTFFFAMLIPFNRVMRNPTLTQEIKDKGLGDHYPFGFPMYAVGQCADILAFRPALVPVGEDQLPHLEQRKHSVQATRVRTGAADRQRFVERVPQRIANAAGSGSGLLLVKPAEHEHRARSRFTTHQE